MDKRETDDVVKLLHDKICFFLLQNNESRNISSSNCSGSVKPFDNNSELFYEKTTNNTTGYFFQVGNDKQSVNSEECSDFLKTNYLEKEKDETLNANEYKENEDILSDSNETNSDVLSNGTVYTSDECSVNWKYCAFAHFNINIGNFFADNSVNNAIKEFHRLKMKYFKSNYERYYSVNEHNTIESYDVNICILEALRKNRVDLLINKMKDWKAVGKIENISIDESKDCEKNANKSTDIKKKYSDIYILLTYPKVFTDYYFVDENNIFKKKETETRFSKDSISLKQIVERKENEWLKSYVDTLSDCDKEKRNENSNNKKVTQEKGKQIVNSSLKSTHNISFSNTNEKCVPLIKNSIFLWLHKYYLEKKIFSSVLPCNITYLKNTETLFYMFNCKIWKEEEQLRNLWKEVFSATEYKNSITEYTFRKYMTPALKQYILRVTETRKYKKKSIMDYNYVFKKISSKKKEMMSSRRVKNNKQYVIFHATFPFLNMQLRKKHMPHYKTFAIIGEDYNFFEIGNVIYKTPKKVNCFLPLINEMSVIATEGHSLLIRDGKKTCLCHFPCNDTKELDDFDIMNHKYIMEQQDESINEKENQDVADHPDHLNEENKYPIYALCYNYFDNTVMACSKDYIYIYDLQFLRCKKRVLLLDRFEERIGEMTAVCYVHAFMDGIHNRENKEETEKREMEKKETEKIGMEKKETEKIETNTNCGNNITFAPAEESQNHSYKYGYTYSPVDDITKPSDFVNHFFRNCNKKRNNIFFIGTKNGNIYIYNETHEKVDKKNSLYIVCMHSFITVENCDIVQLFYYDEVGRHSILASTRNDVHIRLYYIDHIINPEKREQLNNDHVSYMEIHENWEHDTCTTFYRENRDNQQYYFDILKHLLFTGDMYGNVLIYNINEKSLIFKKSLAYAPIVCLSVNRMIPLMLMATSYNFSHHMSPVLHKKNKKLLLYKQMKYKNNYAKESNRPIFMKCLSLWFIYELMNLYT